MKRKDLISIIICILCAITVGFGAIGIYKLINEPAQNQVEVTIERENSYPKNVKNPSHTNSPHTDIYYN